MSCAPLREARLNLRRRWSSHTALERAARELGMPPAPTLLRTAAHEQLRMLLAHTKAGTVVATGFGVVLAFQLASRVPPGQLAAWLVAKLAVAIARLLLARAYAHQKSPSGHWHAGMLALLAIDGLVWGVAGWRLMDQPVTTVAVVVVALDGVSCVATFGLQMSTRATLAYVAPMLLPLAAGLAWRGDDHAEVSALGQLALLLVLLASAWNSSHRFAAGTLLRLQAQTLVAQKDEALLLAQQQSALRSQFMAKVSHELRTPLHGMLGLARLMHLEASDGTAKRRLELLETSGTHLLALINDLLDVARIDSGHFELHVEPFDLSAQLDQVGEVFALRAADKGLDFTLSSSLPRPCWVQGDAARLRQVLHNLLGNAVKFTRAGGIRLEVLPGPTSGWVLMRVHDSGDGIGEAERIRIFHAFHQAPGSAARPAEGVGLGLTIAREIAAAMDGEIDVASEPGQGSCFTFSARLPEVPGDSGLPGQHRRLPRLVLVAEDDEVNALIVTAFLEGLGVRCERVPDGKQAVTRALRETDRPELVLMDCRMPVMDGLAATADIRRQERTLGLPRLPILALTATASEVDRLACLEAGMDSVIAKPFTPVQLADALRGAARRLAA